MAMDYLSIQVSSIPCEQIFSSSAEINTKKRNKIGSLLMEMLQMLKFHFKKERLNFTNTWITSEGQMLQDEPDEDLLHLLVWGNATEAQKGLDFIIGTLNADDD